MSASIARGTALIVVAAALVSVAPTSAAARPGAHFGVRDDGYRTRAGLPLAANVLRNDPGRYGRGPPHTEPAHGTVTLDADGALRYAPAVGFHGTDSFTYTASDAVRLYRTHLAPLATIGGVALTGGGFGSAVTPVPGHPDQVYGLTDRGPNVDGPNGTKIEPLPGFQPAIGRFLLRGGKAILLERIGLSAADGTPYNGQVNTDASTGETITDLAGNPLPASPNGYDFRRHRWRCATARSGSPTSTGRSSRTSTGAAGRSVGSRRSTGSLPAELRFRVPNKGMEA